MSGTPRGRPPTPAVVARLAERHHMELTEAEAELLADKIAGTVEMVQVLETIPEPTQEMTHSNRQPGRRTDREEDPYNVFITKCKVPGADNGPLSGHDVGLKDHIAVAGVEMTCGSSVLEGYVPKRDATLVTRLLDAGANIVGKLNMEEMSASGSGELSMAGPVLNPREPDHLAGGSSSGSAAAVVAGEVDVAIGGDQGGSIRSPSAQCGCVGLKPTWGLIPHTGAVSLAPTLDYVGPITRSVEDCALVLDVIAGSDGRDPRQAEAGVADGGEYAASLGSDPNDISVAILAESLEWDDVDQAVISEVFAALEAFEAEGATVEERSVPWHAHAPAVWTGILVGEVAAVADNGGVRRFSKGLYDTQFADVFGRGRRAMADLFSPTYKLMVLAAEYVEHTYGAHVYARAQNLREELAASYDAALEHVDVLALPTIPETALEARDKQSLESLVDRGLGGYENRAPFNATGHPAITVPCGTVDGLPVGLEFVGERRDDATVLKVAHAFEANVDWQDR